MYVFYVSFIIISVDLISFVICTDFLFLLKLDFLCFTTSFRAVPLIPTIYGLFRILMTSKIPPLDAFFRFSYHQNLTSIENVEISMHWKTEALFFDLSDFFWSHRYITPFIYVAEIGDFGFYWEKRKTAGRFSWNENVTSCFNTGSLWWWRY